MDNNEQNIENVEKREGVVRTYGHHNNRLAALVEVSCDTDFVARNDEFLKFADELSFHVAANNPENVDGLLQQDWLFDDSKKVVEVLEEQNKKFGEKIEIKSYLRWTLDP